MTSSADQMFARERADERTQLEEREAIGKVPISLSASLQVWVPIELSSVVESLWASHAAAVDATHSTQNVLVWAQLLRVIAQTPPRLTSHVDAKALTPASRRYLLRVALDALRKALAGTDLHVALADVAAVARNVDVPATIALVNDVVHELAAAAWIDAPLLTASTSAPPRSALLLLADDARAGLVAVFGGQGTPWLPELRQLYRTYASVRDFVDRLVARMVLEADQTFSAAQRRELLAHGVDARLWIAAKDVPDDTYLSSAPISMAMIYVVQMAQLLVALHTWAVPLERLHAALRATTGHSQGLFAAATLSSCTSLQSLADRAERMAALLLCTGVRAQLGCGVPPRLPWRRGDLLRESRVAGDGDPTPMLVVSGLSRAHVDRYVDTINATMLGEGADRVIEVALTNAPTSFVVVGHPESLHALATLLRRAEQPATGANSAPADQARVPHSRRKRLFRQKYIMSSVPFHSQQRLQDAATQLERDAARIGIAIERSALRCAVLATDDGRDLRAESSDSLIGTLLSLVLCRPLNWLATTAPLSRAAGVTHVVDFGPGGMGDAGVLFQRIHEGAGVQVLFAGLFEPTSAAPVGAKPALYDHRLEAVPFAQSWVGRFAPRLVQRRDGRLFVDTKFTRLVGRPPLMVAGMTPTTVNHELVAAVLNAGYHCELAGGGLPREPMFRAKVDALMSLLEPGNGISFNLMFLTPQLWRFQYPLVCDLARNGLPVDGVCVAAGVPSLELATEILTQLSTAGVKHVSFKPGSIAAIQAVCEIAAANPAVEIILQWTGGRGGGHHSFEDFHEPILQTYAQIRRCDNVTLVCGSGFGDAASTWPYLSGSWARHYGKPDMPFDGILVASRVMVAREAATCDAAKKLICDAPGIENEADWEKTYEGAVGGVITVKSEMGEPIHKLATRGVLLWAELDRDFFNIEPKERRTALIQQRKQYLIDRINADSQKVYFGVDERGDACDLEQMTYAGVLRRMIALMYIAAPSTGKPRWIDESYASRVLQFAQRLESLLTHAPRVLPRLHQQRDKLASAPVQRSRLPPLAVLLATPHEWLVSALALFKGAAERQLLASSDVSFFLALCRTGGKPVNFVPVIDDDLAFWFKKDSLWFSEDIDAVPERDVGRVCILQGPVAVRYAKTPNEPVKQILDSIHDGWLELLRADAGAAPLTVVDCIGGAGRGSGESTAAPLVWHKCAVPTPLPDSPARLADVVAHRASPAADMSSEAFRLAIATAATGDSGWLRAVVLVPQIAGARRRAANPFLGALAPRAGLSVVIVRSNKTGHATEFVVFEDGENDARRCVLRLRSLAADSVEAFVYHRHPSLAVSGVHANDQALSAVQMIETPLHLRLAYRPECALCPLFEDEAERARAVRALYRRLWSTEAPVATPPASPARGTTPTPVPAAAAVVRSPSVDVPFGERVWQHSAVCEANSIVSFCRSVGRPVVLGTDGLLRAPIDYAIVLAWDSVVRPLLDDALGGDLLKLVHRSNAFKRGRDAPTGPHENVFRAQQTVRVRVRVVAVEAQAAGLLIAVEATLSEEARELCVLRSEFLFRGDDAKKACGVAQFSDERHERQMNVDDDADVAILRSKSWLVWAAEDGGASLQRGARLVFEVDARLSIDGNGRRSTQARGSVFAIGKTRHQRSLLATVNHTAQALEPSRRGAVLAFLQRHTAPIETAAFFESGGYQMLTEPDRTLAPSENTRYALASGDLNPIHTQPVFARLASLPSTIVHGMWTSANARRVVDALVAHDLPDRVLDYSAEFVGMVPSDEPLLTRVQHIGMRAGRLIVGVNVRGATSGETVLTARADVRTPRTAYVFTGQGSAAKNMGMELFKASEHARAVWNEADAHFVARYGISILQVVRENPKEIVVRFGGTNGAAIRAHYRSLARQVPDAADASRTVSQPLFPEIGEHSSSFTFRHPDGLLFSTEFAQPALVLVELAAFRDMRAHALVADDCTFAGHSLGEYAALASVGQCLELRDLVDIVFLRGITMQNAVVRDSAGRSDFAMIAVNPVRVHAKLFREPQLTELVALVSKSLGKLVQVVNFNVENYQYVVAGDRSALCVMGDALSALKRVKPFRCDAETLELVVKGAMAHFAASHPAGQFVELTRGDATIPLPGIDVPFHSRFLKPGVPAFRAILQQRLASATFDALSLVGRYVPNVTAVPFALSRDYCERVARDTGSEVLRAVLDRFDDYVATPNELGRLILVELLAYQFASPVRWIETQDLFFRDLRVQRLVEIGPAPTLAGMAMRTLESGKFSPLVKREVLWYERDRDAIYYQLEDREVELPPADDVAPAAPAAPAAPVVVAAAAPVAVAAPVAAAPLVAAPVGDDKGATAFEFVQALLASRLQQPVTAIEKTATIKALVGGKSALQNELLGELENELGKLPDSAAAAEMALGELAAGFDKSYRGDGKVSQQMVHRLFSAKMPGAFSLAAARTHLATRFGFGPQRAAAVLLVAAAEQPKARIGDVGAASAWLDTIASAYAARHGIVAGAVQHAVAPVQELHGRRRRWWRWWCGH
jgi:fatty acid synthase subunit alpha